MDMRKHISSCSDFLADFYYFVSINTSGRHMILYEANMRQNILICVNNVGTSFQLLWVIFKPKIIPRTFLSYLFLKLGMLRGDRPPGSAPARELSNTSCLIKPPSKKFIFHYVK